MVKNPPAGTGDVRCRFDPWAGGGHGKPLQYSCLENPMGRGGWQAIVLWVAKSQTKLRCMHALAHTHVHTHMKA